ncbi:MAG: ATP-binding cassette domain-containing protein [Mariprofundus sp.]|nr:ATP-binding cassette domain-containing protein [Mariprofundus sp.]
MDVEQLNHSPVAAIEQSLLQLLQKLAVPVSSNLYQQACEKVPSELLQQRPVDWVQHLLTEAGIKGVQPIQLGWRRFDQRLLPALVYHNERWYLAERIDSESVTLRHGEGEITEYTEESLQNALVIWLRAPAKKRSERFSLKGNLAAGLVWKEMFREPGWLGKVLAATVLVNLIAVATSIFALQVYDRVVPTQAYATLTTLVGGMVLIVTLDWFLKIVRARILDSMSCAVDKRTSQQLFDHLLHLQLDVQPRSLGTLAAQISGLDSVRQFLSSVLVFAILDMPFALMFIAFIAIIGGAVAWVYLLLLPVALLLGYVTQRRLRRLMREQMMRHNERQGILVDTIRGAESIRAGNATWRFSQQWQEITASIDGFNIQQKAISSISNITTASLSTIAYVSAIVVGVFEIGAGNLTMGGLIACSILGGRVIAPIAQAVQQLAQWQNVEQALQMVNQVLKLPKERREDQPLLLPHDLPNSLALEKIRFAYPQSPIQQINIPELHFKSGERVLLLGQVGCGKSTLLKVLAGLYRPNEGRIRLGDGDLWEIDPLVVASHLSYLPQSVHLFKGTLRSNLALSGTASDSRLLHITRELGVDTIAASNLLGMDLPISEGGDGLSGGQRQLVALARVMINQPRIWILDEPTASLDGESEKNVWRVLEDNVGADDILIVATHRPMQAMALATRVIVMHEGEVVQDGKPESVMTKLMAGRPAKQQAAIAGGMPNVV